MDIETTSCAYGVCSIFFSNVSEMLTQYLSLKSFEKPGIHVLVVRKIPGQYMFVLKVRVGEF